MNLDIAYIEEILKAVDAHTQNKPSMPQKELLLAIGTNVKNDDDLKKFYDHMMHFESAYYLKCGDDHFGFTLNNNKIGVTDTNYEMTKESRNHLKKSARRPFRA